MTEVKKQNHRLFKVAKEFNVSIDTIVDHLRKKGHEVENKPNTKLPGELYNVLHKEFASEKQLKEKAEQIIEKRREETRVNVRSQGEESEEGDGSSHVSADQLRRTIRGNRRRKRKPAEKKPDEILKEELAASTNPINPPVEEGIKVSEEIEVPVVDVEMDKVETLANAENQIIEEVKEQQVAPKEEVEKADMQKVVSQQEKPKDDPKDNSQESGEPKLKILGKIDLKEIQKTSNKRSGRNRDRDRSNRNRTGSNNPPRDRNSSNNPTRERKPRRERRVPTNRQSSSNRPDRKEKTPPRTERREERFSRSGNFTKNKPIEESKSSNSDIGNRPFPEKHTSKTSNEKSVVETPEIKNPSVQEEQQPKDVMRAGDRTPNLRGLKVMGKIELPSNKPKKKKEKEEKQRDQKSEDKRKQAATTSQQGNQQGNSDGNSEDADKKRRRRRRKRKRKTAVQADVKQTDNKKTDNSGNKDSGGRKKKEKVTKKEVDASIRQTYSQMNKAPSRNRQRLRRQKRDSDAKRREEERKLQEAEAKVLQLTEFITANEFANLIDVQVNEIITKSFELGIMVSINQRLDAELLSILAEEYGYKAEFIDVTEKEFEEEEEVDAPEDLEERSPIITVMGHVDHGKTTLLDFLRKTNVTSQEAGGITQHIGAYEVKLKNGRHVTFLDTPGHEAFTAMRARGAKVTDVVIVVVAADDSVMPQTKEAINHAQAAGVPMVFAINKIDKPTADAEKIKGQLAEMNILVEDWGGKYQSQEISALKGISVDELLEKVTLESDLMELKANPSKAASGTVIEARLDKGRGNVATILVQTGTLKVGDEMVAGIHYGKVRALIDQNGHRIKEAGPSTPVQVLGLSGQPQAGDKFQIFTEDGKAKDISQKRVELFREQQFRQTKHLTLDEITRRRAIGNFEELNIIIRGDVDGSVEALSGALLKLSTDEVQVNILLKGVGAITESDVTLASASDAVIIAFNVRPNGQARQLADKEGIEMRTYSVIYDAINDVRDALEGLLSPELKEEMLGTAEVLEVFKISKVGAVAGCLVTSGKLYRSEPVRVIRDDVVIYDSKFASLKRFKDDAKEVYSGQECGAMIENYNDIKVGDVFECYRVNEIRRKL